MSLLICLILGLVNELLSRLSNAAGPAVATGTQNSSGKAPSTTNATATAPDAKATAASVSTIISLLSTLCRGSPTITHVFIDLVFFHSTCNSLFLGFITFRIT